MPLGALCVHFQLCDWSNLQHSCRLLSKISGSWKLLALLSDFPSLGRYDSTPSLISIWIAWEKPNHIKLRNENFSRVHSVLDTEAELLMSSQAWFKFTQTSLISCSPRSINNLLFHWVLQSGHYLQLNNCNLLFDEIHFLIDLKCTCSGPNSVWSSWRPVVAGLEL